MLASVSMTLLACAKIQDFRVCFKSSSLLEYFLLLTRKSRFLFELKSTENKSILPQKRFNIRRKSFLFDQIFKKVIHLNLKEIFELFIAKRKVSLFSRYIDFK